MVKRINKYIPATKPTGATNDPIAVWHFWNQDPGSNPNEWLEDKTPNGRDLVVSTGSFEFYNAPDTDMVGMYLDPGQDHLLVAPDDEAFRLAKEDGGGGDGAFTIEAVFHATADQSTVMYCLSSGESLQTNALYLMRVVSEKIADFAEYDAGSNIAINYDAGVALNRTWYVAITCSSDGLTRKCYVDGELFDTIVSANNAEKASSANTQRLYFGNDGSGNADFKGYMFSARVTAEEFSAAMIQETYEGLLEEGVVGHIDLDLESRNQGSWEDNAIEFGTNTAPKHSDTLGLGGSQAIPGALGHESQRTGPDAESGWEDSAARLGVEIEKNTQETRFQETGLPVPLLEGKYLETAIEDVLVHLLSGDPTFKIGTFDQYGHNHFGSTSGSLIVWEASLYDTRGEPWADPATYSFTGFGRDGTQYTNGVQDPGPVYAPWYTEGSGGGNANRSPRGPFPEQALIVITQGNVGELVIFDLDNFDPGMAADSLEVWMRFPLGGAGSFLMLGRINTSLQFASMANGILTVATRHNGTENGGVFVLDFRYDGTQNAHQLVRADNHWRIVSGKDLTNRTETSLWTTTLDPSAPTGLRLASESVYRAMAWTDPQDPDPGTFWVAATGDDPDPSVLTFQASLAVQLDGVNGDDLGASNQDYFHRAVLVDKDGWLWFSRDQKIWRSASHWRSGRVFQFTPYTSTDFRRARHQRGITLPHPIYWLTQARDYIFAATTIGVFAIHRGTMEYHLAYSIDKLPGQGRSPATGTGQRMAGDNPRPYKIWGFDVDLSGYLAIASTWEGDTSEEIEGGGGGGGITIVRLRDDAEVQRLEYPNVLDDGAYFNIPFTRVGAP